MENLQETLKKFLDIFKRVVKGKIKIAVLLGVIGYGLFKLIHIPFPEVLSVVLFLSNLVPYAGPFIGGGLTVLIVLFFGSGKQSLMVFMIIVGLQLLEGLYVEPKILGKELNLHPLWVFLSVLIGGTVFGIPGMVLALPLVVIIKELVRK